MRADSFISRAGTTRKRAVASGSMRGSLPLPPPDSRKEPISPRACPPNFFQCAAIRHGVAPRQGGHPQKNIRWGIPGPQWIALLQDGGEGGGEGGGGVGFGGQHHRGEAGMRAEGGHAAPGRGYFFRRVQRAQFQQQRFCRGERAGGRLIGKRQVRGRGAPAGAIEQKGRKLGFQDFGFFLLRQAAMQRLRPQPDGDARCFPPGAAGALVGGGAADAQGGEAGQAGRLVQPRRPPPAAVDDNFDAGHGKRRFRDRRRQHHAPPLGWAESAVLLGGRQVAVQRENKRAASFQCRLGAADFRHAGEKSQNVSRMLGQGGAHGAGHRIR
jgi:hypothetical protein